MSDHLLRIAIVLSCLGLACGGDGAAPPRTEARGDAASEGDAAAARDASEPDAGPQLVANQAGLTLQLPDGALEGVMVEGTRAFTGIPYAAPPLGALRFAPPAPPVPWSGTLDASGPGAACPQDDTLVPDDGDVEKTEDCLQLNVFAPQTAPATPLPVMVWLHGGSNANGSANQLADEGLPRVYDGAVLRASAARDVVVVTVNYRLGAFGFLAHRALRTEQGAAGNYGLMDQQAALRWVQRNIAAFGGDPRNVTLFGESAGAWGTCYQLVAPGRQGLLHRAILQSGSCTHPVMTRAQAEAYADDFAARVGCDDGDDEAALACLRALSMDELVLGPPAPAPGGDPLVYGERITPFASAGGDPGSFAVVDERFILEQPVESFAAGRFERVPMIVGTNAREASFFLRGATAFEDEAQYQGAMAARLSDAAAAAIVAQYPAAMYASANEAAIDATTDFVFVCPARTLARLASEHTDVYVYNWDRASAIPTFAGLGATHAVELSWLWNLWRLVGGNAEEAPLTTLAGGYWTRMAERGDPNGDGAPRWPSYSAGTDPELRIDLEPRVEEGRRNARCDFWDELLPDGG